MPRFSHADDTTTQGQGMCGIETAKLKEGNTFTNSKDTNLLEKLLNAARQGKSSQLCFDLHEENKNRVPPFIKRSSFTPSATRPQLQGNQTHLFSPEERSLLTAAFSALLVKCTHQVALFSYQPEENTLTQ